MELTKEFWDKIYAENASKMKGICFRYVADKQIAEDLMHDAFITAINKAESYSGKGSIEGWLRKITVNTALMHLRTNNAKKIHDYWLQNNNEYQIMDEPNDGQMRSVIEQADFSDSDLLNIIDLLPEHHRLVFNMYVIDNYSHAQIADELNISIGTSKSQLARARKKLQQMLYQKALERNKETRFKKRALALLILPFKANYIDNLFKQKLLNFSLETSVNQNIAYNSINWNHVLIPKIKPYHFFTNVNNWIIGSISGGILVTGITYYTIKNNHQVPDNKTNDNKTLNISTIPYDTLKQSTKTDTPKTISIPSKKPIIVKKTVIVHKTIVIRDTIKTTDTSHVK